jgi:signal peptide peptidase SppA
VHLNGVIAPAGVPGPQATLNLTTVGPLLERAFTTAHVQAVVLVINCPGGSPTQSGLLGERIRMLADKHEVPVIAVVEDLAASGGYWLACAADEILAHNTSMVGSIGVISAGFGYTGLIDKLGVERRLRTAGDHKARLDPFSAVSDEDEEWMQRQLTELHEMFRAWVQDRRGDRLSANQEVFSGDVWTGAAAVDLGLIDGLGTLHSLMHDRFPEAKLLDITPPVPMVAKLLFGARRSGTPMSMIARALADEEHLASTDPLRLR